MYTLISFIGFGVLFTLLFVVLLISHWNSETELRHSLAYSYILRIAGLILIFIKYILFQPMVTVLMTTVKCTKQGLTKDVADLGYECYSEVHIILMVTSALVILMLVALSVFSTLFFSDEDPESRLPWAYCSRMLEIYKMIRKLLVSIAIYATADNVGTGVAVIIFALLLSGLCLHLVYKQMHMKDRKILYSLMTAEGMLGWFILLCLIYVVTDLDWTHPIAILVFVIVFFTCTVLANRERCDTLISLQTIDSLKEVTDVETYCRILLEKVTNSKAYPEITIEGFIQMHTANCKADHCPCRRKLTANLESKEDEEVKCQEGDDDTPDCGKGKGKSNEGKGTIYRGSLMLGTTPGDLVKPAAGDCHGSEGTEMDRIQHDLIKIIINDLIVWNEKQDGKARLHIYMGYLKATCLNNKLAALYEVMCAEESNPNLYERFLAYRLMRRIEDQIVKKESREHSSNEIDNLIQFQQILAEMQENMQEVLKLFIGFWKELQDESPNFQYLGNMSHDISQNAIKIRGQYRRLIAINPTNLYCRMLYALFLKKIIKDEFEAYDVYDETTRASNNIRIQNTHSGDDKYGANSKTALFIISGAKANVGEVLCINNEVSELLGYEKGEIVGHNISKAMPPMIGEKHSEMVLKYLCSGSLDRTGEKMALALHKLGYIVPCWYLHRVVPNLSRGLQLIGFVYKIGDFSECCRMLERNISPDDVVIILTDQNWMMQAFNTRAAKLFGIIPTQANLKKYIFGEEKISAAKLIPQLEDPNFVQTLASSLSVEVVLDGGAIRKTIDAEIEILRAAQGDEAEGTPMHTKDDLERGLEMTYDGSYKGPLTYIDLTYGKYETDKKASLNMKLIVIMLDQLLEKDGNKPAMESSSDLMWNAKTKKKDDIFMDDVLSQSQSSHSSHSSTEHEQRTVRTFKETIKEQKSPFFARCFIKLGILIFLLILASAIMEYVLIDMMIQFIDQSLGNSVMVHRRFNYLLNIPNNFRTVANIFQGLEANASEVYVDRVQEYADIIAQESELLRDLSNQIDKMRHPFSAEHKAILQTPCIKFEEKPDPSSATNVSASMNYTLSVAITQYVAKATELKQYDLEKIKAGYLESGQTFDRLASFMIDNAKGTLTYYADKTKELFFTEYKNEIDSKARVITIALIVDPIVIILLMILFIPFILKVQSNLLKIYLHLCQFKDADIRKWLEICNNSSSDIKCSITRIRKIYGGTSFEVILNGNVKEEEKSPADVKGKVKVKDTTPTTQGKDEDRKPTSMVTTTQNQTEAQLLKQSETGEEGSEEQLKSKEDVLSERKQKMFSQMTKEKTKTYLLYLLFFAVYIGAFRAADAVIFSNVYNETDLRVYLLRMLSTREHNDLRSIFYLREELRLNRLIPFFDGSNFLCFSFEGGENIRITTIIVSDSAGYYTDAAFDSEMEYSKSRATLTGPLNPLRDFLGGMDYDQECDLTLSDSAQIKCVFSFLCAGRRKKKIDNNPKIKVCREAYSGLNLIGLNSVIINAFSYAKKTHSRFVLEYTKNAFYAAQQLGSVDVVKMSHF